MCGETPLVSFSALASSQSQLPISSQTAAQVVRGVHTATARPYLQAVRTSRGMRLARACLLLAAALQARAFTPAPPVAPRTTRLHAREEANVGTAVRNIAPWLIFVLVGTAPRSNHFTRQPRRHRAVTQPTGRFHNRAGAAHPELQGVRRREGPRSLREPAAVLPVALRARRRRRGVLTWLLLLSSACASMCRGRSTATRLSLCGIATLSHRCSYGSTSRRLVRRPKYDFHTGLSPSSTPSPARRTASRTATSAATTRTP